MEATLQMSQSTPPRKNIFSWPLLKQSIKANWVLFLVITIGMAAIMAIINLVVGTQNLGRSIDMGAVSQYVTDEDMNWLQILGLFQVMGFSLSKLQAMSSMDMTAILNELIYNVAALLLPIVYIILITNKLVVSQVDNGSMAYVLSTPTSRGRVIRTQLLFLISSITIMYIFVTAVAMGTEVLGLMNNPSKALPLRTFLLNAGEYLTILSLAFICFMFSCIFNRSKNSLAIGGGLSIVSFIANVLALFGGQTFINLGVGVPGMGAFQYISILTLYDTESIDAFAKAVTNYNGTPSAAISYTWIIEIGILLFVGIACLVVGSKVFKKKDLPL